MFLRCGKNKGDEGSLFQWMLAMAAAATTAMYFSPISEIWAFENADPSVEFEQRPGRVKPSVDGDQAGFHHECP